MTSGMLSPMPWLTDYAQHFPMAPLGGVFVAAVGLFIILGSLIGSWRMALLWIGFAAGVTGIVFGGHLTKGLPSPTTLQIGSLAVAIVVEMIAFRVIMPGLRTKGERALVIGSLGIVGVHFFIMYPAFGPVIAVLAAACTLNALAAWRAPGYGISAAWALDGLLKCLGGALLIATAPVLH